MLAGCRTRRTHGKKSLPIRLTPPRHKAIWIEGEDISQSDPTRSPAPQGNASSTTSSCGLEGVCAAGHFDGGRSGDRRDVVDFRRWAIDQRNSHRVEAPSGPRAGPRWGFPLKSCPVGRGCGRLSVNENAPKGRYLCISCAVDTDPNTGRGSARVAPARA